MAASLAHLAELPPLRHFLAPPATVQLGPLWARAGAVQTAAAYACEVEQRQADYGPRAAPPAAAGGDSNMDGACAGSASALPGGVLMLQPQPAAAGAGAGAGPAMVVVDAPRGSSQVVIGGDEGKEDEDDVATQPLEDVVEADARPAPPPAAASLASAGSMSTLASLPGQPAGAGDGAAGALVASTFAGAFLRSGPAAAAAAAGAGAGNNSDADEDGDEVIEVLEEVLDVTSPPPKGAAMRRTSHGVQMGAVGGVGWQDQEVGPPMAGWAGSGSGAGAGAGSSSATAAAAGAAPAFDPSDPHALRAHAFSVLGTPLPSWGPSMPRTAYGGADLHDPMHMRLLAAVSRVPPFVPPKPSMHIGILRALPDQRDEQGRPLLRVYDRPSNADVHAPFPWQRFFDENEDVQIPDGWTYVKRRVRLEAGKPDPRCAATDKLRGQGRPRTQPAPVEQPDVEPALPIGLEWYRKAVVEVAGLVGAAAAGGSGGWR